MPFGVKMVIEECLQDLERRYPKGYDFSFAFRVDYLEYAELYYMHIEAGVTAYSLYRDGAYVNTWRD